MAFTGVTIGEGIAILGVLGNVVAWVYNAGKMGQKIESMEKTLNNGLTTKVADTQEKVEQVLVHQAETRTRLESMQATCEQREARCREMFERRRD